MNKRDLIEAIQELPDDMECDSYLIAMRGNDNFYSTRQDLQQNYFEWIGWLHNEIFEMQSDLRMQNERDRLNDLIGED